MPKPRFIFCSLLVTSIACAVLGWLCLPSTVPPSREVLLARASDPFLSPEARGRAVFGLFAHHVPAGATAATIRSVFRDCDWIDNARIHHFMVQTGVHPLRMEAGSSLFRLDLFTEDESSPSEWIMYVRLSEGKTPGDVVRFF